ncbi:hypothetical protein M5D96_013475 [Drosophila gunungcola]|uniref:Uncharacterized protein n=1 Tax=Drosophila gunungcola TaxID=103775 RepID=A0A9P9YBR5_9MUSC|nr:hypothetical protein M5D96_013475 [Drosophila gunungcola]
MFGNMTPYTFTLFISSYLISAVRCVIIVLYPHSHERMKRNLIHMYM